MLVWLRRLAVGTLGISCDVQGVGDRHPSQDGNARLGLATACRPFREVLEQGPEKVPTELKSSAAHPPTMLAK